MAWSRARMLCEESRKPQSSHCDFAHLKPRKVKRGFIILLELQRNSGGSYPCVAKLESKRHHFFHEEEGYQFYQLELGKQLAYVLTECSSRHQGESEEVWTKVAIYSHALLRIHVIGGQWSVRIPPPSLPPHHSNPAISLKDSVQALL